MIWCFLCFFVAKMSFEEKPRGAGLRVEFMKQDAVALKRRSDNLAHRLHRFNRRNLWIALFVLFLQLTLSCSYRETKVKSPLPPPPGFVADYANVIDSASRGRLESILTELKNKSAIEFAVVTVDSTGGQPIFDYSLAVARGWGIGPKDSARGGGLLLMLAIKDRQWRIQVSRGLEKDLPDEFCKSLGQQLEDLCRQRKYAEGITRYVEGIIKRLEETRRT
jgi:uncharacterized membrane protein YgcG